MISVIDYGVCNLGSMLNMLRKVGVQATLVSTARELDLAKKIILPGVGAFDNGMSALRERGLDEALRRRVVLDQIPLLGVCLGMQMLGRRSDEGTLDGLGLVDFEARRFRFGPGSAQKVPHMGWSLLAPRRDSPLLHGLDASSRFYFCHAYHVVCSDAGDLLASTDYGGDVAAIVQHGNVYGVQFHPEKSHRFGMALLRNFAGI